MLNCIPCDLVIKTIHRPTKCAIIILWFTRLTWSTFAQWSLLTNDMVFYECLGQRHLLQLHVIVGYEADQ